MNKKILIFVLALTMSAFGAKAQVTIGDVKTPESFSILELISNGNRGLRLPQLTTQQRENITPSLVGNTEAQGLTIFNITTPVYGTLTIDAFVATMYDFQYQTLTAYNQGTPVSYQWYAKKRGAAQSAFNSIEGAIGASYEIPVDFVKNNQTALLGESDNDYNAGVIFACVAEYDDGTYKADTIDFEFIDTNLGDLYQWGRPQDGHEHIEWAKTGGVVGGDFAFGDGTSETTTTQFDPTTATSNLFFIGSGNWANPNNNNLWTSSKTVYDPCPSGWRVPTKDEQTALLTEGSSFYTNPSSATQNTWTWRPNTGNRIAGGYIVTFGTTGNGDLNNNSRLFLPASGYRNFGDATLYSAGTIGYFCGTFGY
jgi:hypothetical protein